MMSSSKLRLAILVALNLCFLIEPFVLPVSLYSDELGMLLIASGGFGYPSAHLVFSSPLYGYLLKYLYLYIPQWEWYTVLLYAFSLLSFNILYSDLLLRKEGSGKKVQWPLILLLFVTQVYLLLTPYFTQMAFQMSLVSLVHLTLWYRSLKGVACSFLLFFFACLIRFEAAMIPYLIITPFFIVKLFCGRAKSDVRNVLLLLSVYLCVAFSVTQLDKLAYTAPEWKAYCEYNAIRGKINDFPMFVGEPFSGDDIRQDEYALMKNFLPDGTIFTKEDYAHISKWAKEKFMYELVSAPHIILDKYVRPYIERYGVLLVLMLLMFVVWGVDSVRSKKWDLGVIVTIMVFVGANVSVMLMSFPKNRVIYPLFVSLYVVYSYYLYSRGKRNMLYLFHFAVSLFFLFQTKTCIDKNFQKRSEMGKYERLLDQCKCEKIQIDPGSFTAGGYDAFHMREGMLNQHIVGSGWMVNSPFTKQYYSGLLSYVDGHLPYMYKISREEKCVNRIVNLLKRYYHIDVRQTLIASEDDLRVVYFERIDNTINKE